MKDFDTLKEQILKEYDRLGPDDSFSFRCHNQLACFNKCCGDVNIFLTPYDILRLKNRLGLTSTEFLKRYTVKPFTKEQQLPVVVLKLDDEKENKPCFFVTEQGCSVYEDRPWPCRMYPVGQASARTEKDPNAPEFYFLMREQPCDGFDEGPTWTIRQWIKDQGVEQYDEMGEFLRELTLHPHFRAGGTLNPQQMEMYFMACYDLDRFRSFIFESSFLQKYEVEPALAAQLKSDDVALLKFSYRWLRTCLFSEKLVPLKGSTVDQYKERLVAQGKRPQ
jgi:uncharacterized protein